MTACSYEFSEIEERVPRFELKKVSATPRLPSEEILARYLTDTSEFEIYQAADRSGLSLAMRRAIGEALAIAKLEDNWDDEGSPGYLKETIERAVAFLKDHAALAWGRSGAVLGAPQISPADAGSIDLYWADEERTLLINFPPTGQASYFGRLKTGQSIKGPLDTGLTRPDLLAWLLQ